MARSRSSRAQALLIGLLAALAVLVLAGAAGIERREVALDDGTICGSVWHNRPSAGYVDVSSKALLTHLRSLPEGPRHFAAVDGDGVVCGASGSQAFLSDAYVFFVNTVPGGGAAASGFR